MLPSAHGDKHWSCLAFEGLINKLENKKDIVTEQPKMIKCFRKLTGPKGWGGGGGGALESSPGPQITSLCSLRIAICEEGREDLGCSFDSYVSYLHVENSISNLLKIDRKIGKADISASPGISTSPSLIRGRH